MLFLLVSELCRNFVANINMTTLYTNIKLSMKKIIALLMLLVSICADAQVKNPFIWADCPDPDIIRVDDYYYLVSTTMHVFPGGPIMRSKDLAHWETVSYLFDEIKDTPRYDLQEGTVYGRGQWATSLRYHKGTFWALFVANDDPHKSMVFKTDDPAKGWKLHSRLPAYHDSSLFFDDDDRVYVFSGSGNISLVELNADLTAEKPGGIRKRLELKGQPRGLHEGSRVIKHDGMYYLFCIAWPNTGREEICYRSKNIEGPYESRVMLKSDFGGFSLAGQGTIVDGKHGEWYGVIFQDRNGIGRVLTLEPCTWVDGWPMLGGVDWTNPQTDASSGQLSTFAFNGKIPEVVDLHLDCECHKTPAHATITKDYQWNHNVIKEGITTASGSLTLPGEWVKLTTQATAKSIYDARNTITWRTWGPTCADTITIDARKMKDGDVTGLAAFNGDSGLLSLRKEGKDTYLVFSEENVALTNDTKAITDVTYKEVERIKVPASKLGAVRMVMTGDFNPNRDIANFYYSLDGKKYQQIGGDYKMRFDYRRLFMGSRYAAYYYSTKAVGGTVTIKL